jgi:hypothetical protein
MPNMPTLGQKSTKKTSSSLNLSNEQLIGIGLIFAGLVALAFAIFTW